MSSISSAYCTTPPFTQWNCQFCFLNLSWRKMVARFRENLRLQLVILTCWNISTCKAIPQLPVLREPFHYTPSFARGIANETTSPWWEATRRHNENKYIFFLYPKIPFTRLWNSRLGDPISKGFERLNKRRSVNGEPTQVIRILQEGFDFGAIMSSAFRIPSNRITKSAVS